MQEATTLMHYFPKIPTFDGFKARLTDGWYIQEKYDGSQMSFRLIDGRLEFYCKNKRANGNSFDKAQRMLQHLVSKLDTNLIYHGEVISKQRHNCVVYNQVPKWFFVLYDIQYADTGLYEFHQPMQAEAERLGLDSAQLLYTHEEGDIDPKEVGQQLIQQIEKGELVSSLGGTPEGIVIKQPQNKKHDKLVATKGKMVTRAFKEVQKIKKPKTEYSPEEFFIWLGKHFAMPARFQKGWQHCQDRDQIPFTEETVSEQAPKVVNKALMTVMEDLNQDFDDEYETLIKDYLYAEFGDSIRRAARAGFREWYYEKLNLPDPAQLYNK